jgi:flagellar motor switch protein FliM
MSDQILTQEEIDALLSAMGRGDVDLEEESREDVQAAPYNLTSQHVMLRDQFNALEEVYDKFANSLRRSLSSNLQQSIDVQFVSTEMAKYHDFIGGFSSPVSFQIFSMQPLIGSALLAIEPQLVFSLIDCMFGGDGKPTAKIREFTLIEQRMINKFANELLQKFQEAWSVLFAIEIAITKSETKPEYVRLVAPNDIMLVIVFSVQGEEFIANFSIGVPYLMLEPIKEKLSSKYIQQKATEHTWGQNLEKLLQDTQITLIAELGRSAQTVKHLLELQVEDVIQLDTGPEDPINITVDGILKYSGYPGIIKGSRAIEIIDRVPESGGKSQA